MTPDTWTATPAAAAAHEHHRALREDDYDEPERMTRAEVDRDEAEVGYARRVGAEEAEATLREVWGR